MPRPDGHTPVTRRYVAVSRAMDAKLSRSTATPPGDRTASRAIATGNAAHVTPYHGAYHGVDVALWALRLSATRSHSMTSPGEEPSTRQNAVVGRRTRSASDPRLDRVRDDMLRTVSVATDMAGGRAHVHENAVRCPRTPGFPL